MFTLSGLGTVHFVGVYTGAVHAWVLVPPLFRAQTGTFLPLVTDDSTQWELDKYFNQQKSKKKTVDSRTVLREIKNICNDIVPLYRVDSAHGLMVTEPV